MTCNSGLSTLTDCTYMRVNINATDEKSEIKYQLNNIVIRGVSLKQ